MNESIYDTMINTIDEICRIQGTSNENKRWCLRGLYKGFTKLHILGYLTKEEYNKLTDYHNKCFEYLFSLG